ncbi:MAG: hypothetical protein JWO46_1952 [Nocardioidaceae bacterium]|nr:hypothetical protein [Nocardioidaceae bacterium]
MNLRLLFRDLVVRFVLLVAIDQGLTYLIDRTSTTPDADIGAGLIGLAALGLTGVVGGLVDGFRRPFPHLAAAWIGAAALLGITSCVLLQLGHGPVDWSVLWSDLADLGPFLTGLVAFPAVLAGGVASLGTPTAPLSAQPPTSAGEHLR